MITIRKSSDRGYADHGWLKSHHTFSFASYHDPDQIGFRSLRVMNEDRVAAGQGFGTHAHDNMEIVSYVLSGALEHKDSMGNGEVLTPGEFQRISAGTGITHSEFNPSPDQPTHFYQIWLLPNEQAVKPSYEQKRFDDQVDNKFRLVASPNGENGSLSIHSDSEIYLAKVGDREVVNAEFAAERHGWLQVLSGAVRLDDQLLSAGDGAAISDESSIQTVASADSELMLFDLA